MTEDSRTIAIIQARLGSSRLPGKVLEDLAGQPMLARVVSRTRRAETLDGVVVATTVLPADDAIVDLCKERGWPCFRGSQDDVLDRYYQAATVFRADIIVRITSDCPLIEPEIIDRVVSDFREHRPAVDYASNTLTRTYPRGLDTEVMSLAALQRAWREDDSPARREHVTPYIYRHPDIFNIRNIAGDTDYSGMRWTVDTPEDLAFVRRIYGYFQHDSFTWEEVLGLLVANPAWLEINRDIKQKIVP